MQTEVQHNNQQACESLLSQEEHLAALEAVLFCSSDPLSALKLAEIFSLSPSEIDELLQALQTYLAENKRGIQLKEVAGGWRLFSHPAYHSYIENYVSSWDTHKLSQAALETLAVIAYHQPVTRDGVKAVRGVNSDSVIASLVEKGLVRELGRDKKAGMALLYGTTQRFLEKFALRSIKELPPLENFAADDKSRELIRQRLSQRSQTALIFSENEPEQEETLQSEFEHED